MQPLSHLGQGTQLTRAGEAGDLKLPGLQSGSLSLTLLLPPPDPADQTLGQELLVWPGSSGLAPPLLGGRFPQIFLDTLLPASTQGGPFSQNGIPPLSGGGSLIHLWYQGTPWVPTTQSPRPLTPVWPASVLVPRT